MLRTASQLTIKRMAQRHKQNRRKTLFVIDGAFGPVKANLVSYLDASSRQNGLGYIKKYSWKEHDYPIKTDISQDLIEIDEQGFKNKQKDESFVFYRHSDQYYGFDSREVERQFREDSKDHLFVVVRSQQTIKDLQERFPQFGPIVVFVYIEEDSLKHALTSAYEVENHQELEFHLARRNRAWRDFLKHPDLYDAVVNHPGEQGRFIDSVESLIDNCGNIVSNGRFRPDHQDEHHLLLALRGHGKLLAKHASQYDRRVFVMMKFRSENKHLYDLIEAAVVGAGFQCERADKKNITKDVYNPLAYLYTCKFGVALFDANYADEVNQYSVNVAYELGMMQAQGKQCLVLRSKELPEEIPFDIVKDLRKEYSAPDELPEIVSSWLSDLVESDMS